jgi:hypothetical protein
MKHLHLAIYLFLSLAGYAQKEKTADSIQSRVILIGDGGAFRQGKHPVVTAIRNHFALDKKTTIVYLGDNVYRHGLPDDASVDYQTIRAVLDTQVNIAKNSPSKVYMIPGNHDWENGGRYGYEALMRQQSYVNQLGDANVSFVPANGCPGPEEIKLSDDVVLIVFDSQWWLHPFEKPDIESDCECKTESEFVLTLTEMLRENYNKLVILASHHPFRSNGIHGGYYGLKQHIFPLTDLNHKLYIPLPLIGSIYPISRGIFGNVQDLPHPAYQNMIRQVKAATSAHPNLIFANGHEHNLQLLKDDSGYHYIVSGSGCKVTRVNENKKSLFANASLGFAVLEISKNKNVRTRFFTVEADSSTLKERYSENIIDFSKLPVLAKDTTTVQIPAYKDFVAAPASNQYKDASGFRKFFLGKNYRDIWSQPVYFPVFRLKETKGGFRITRMGGGKQTKSLSLEDKNGKPWALRTIDKEPDAVMPEGLRGSIAEDIVQDMISAANPYAPMVLYSLATSARIPHAKPEFYIVPDDPAFGYYRTLFANKVVMLEPKDASRDGSDTRSTISVIGKLIENNDHRVIQKDVLKARLLDMLVADWDRHLDQWKWAEQDTGQGKIYYPIPKDRDQAFFYSDGLLLGYASRRQLPYLKGFRRDIPDVKHLGHSTRHFDRLFLNELTRKDWDSISSVFIAQMTDTVLNKAVHQFPKEIYAINGPKIYEKLKSRRGHLAKAAEDYYKFLSKRVNVLGSNETEYFNVTKEKDGKIRVHVTSQINKDTSFIKYERVFDPDETKEIRLYGFNGNDYFNIKADRSSGIVVRVIGGKGADTFNVSGNIRNYLYDQTSENNYLYRGRGSHTRFSEDPRVNYFDYNEYKYNISRYPRLNIGFNGDDGFLIGAGFWHQKHSFRKEPYTWDQRLNTLFALGQDAYQLRYRSHFVDVLKLTDIMVNAELLNPVLNNFYGFGNETTIDESKDIRFYRVRYSYFSADVLFRRKIGDFISFTAGPSYYTYWNKPDKNKGYILGHPPMAGLDSLNVYSNKSYAGLKFGMLVNTLNNELFPTRGINWYSEFSEMRPLTSNTNELTKIQSDMVVYSSLSDPARVVSVLRLGGGHIFNRNFEYFQAMNLGANNFLRGFRKNRFSGHSLAYGSLEFRIRLFDSKNYVIPGQFGLVVFNDVGRVWYKEESSRQWHYAYGGGFYLVPYNMVLVSATIAFSKEEQVFNFTIGTKLNLTF